jgi:hypothetical protein
MSWNPALEPGCPDAMGIDAIETLRLQAFDGVTAVFFCVGH